MAKLRRHFRFFLGLAILALCSAMGVGRRQTPVATVREGVAESPPLGAATSSTCSRFEARFVRGYSCLDDPSTYICWLTLFTLENNGCTPRFNVPFYQLWSYRDKSAGRTACFRRSDQRCVSSDDPCPRVSGLCAAGNKCCRHA